jgi:hypothetical protein
VDQCAHAGDEHAHGDRKGVDQDAHRHGQPADVKPGEVVVQKDPVRVGQIEHPGQCEAGHHERGPDGDRGNPAGQRIAKAAPEKDQHDKPGQRQERHEVGKVEHGSGQPFSDWGRSPFWLTDAPSW